VGEAWRDDSELSRGYDRPGHVLDPVRRGNSSPEIGRTYVYIHICTFFLSMSPSFSFPPSNRARLHDFAPTSRRHDKIARDNRVSLKMRGRSRELLPRNSREQRGLSLNYEWNYERGSRVHKRSFADRRSRDANATAPPKAQEYPEVDKS